MLTPGEEYLCLNDVMVPKLNIPMFCKGTKYLVNSNYYLVGEDGCLMWRSLDKIQLFNQNFQLVSGESRLKKAFDEIKESADDNDSYEKRMDKIFSGGAVWKHRTLRTIFDPFSSEWDNTDYVTKIEILNKIITSGENLDLLISDYKFHYIKQNRKDIATVVESALSKLLEFKLRRDLNG